MFIYWVCVERMSKRKKKYKVVKVEGTKVAVELKKDHERPVVPPPVVTHKSDDDYDRNRFRKETRRLSEEH